MPPTEEAAPASRRAGTRPRFRAPGRDRECQPAPPASRGGRGPVHVLFLKEVPRLRETSGTKARQEPGLLGERPRHLK